MPLTTIAKLFTALLSWLILAAAAYLLWSWYDGLWARDVYGRLVHLREPWRLWTGGALLAWSALGRFGVKLLLARGGGRPTAPLRGDGEMIRSPSGASLYVETCGRAGAPLIVLTHGWGMDPTFWRYAKEDLGGRFRLVLWDLAGLGRSRLPPDGRVDLRRFAEDLLAVLDHAGQPAVVVGHSIGGMTIQTAIRDHPEAMRRLKGVVLLNTTYTNPLRTMIFAPLLTSLQPVLAGGMRLAVWLKPLVWLSKWQSYFSGSAHLAHRLGFGRYVTRSQLEHVTLLATRNDPAVEARGNIAMFHWDATGAMGRLGVPALVIGGERDIVTRPEASRSIADASPRARLQLIEGVNHLGPMEKAEDYNRRIADFVLLVQRSAGRQ